MIICLICDDESCMDGICMDGSCASCILIVLPNYQLSFDDWARIWVRANYGYQYKCHGPCKCSWSCSGCSDIRVSYSSSFFLWGNRFSHTSLNIAFWKSVDIRIKELKIKSFNWGILSYWNAGLIVAHACPLTFPTTLFTTPPWRRKSSSFCAFAR